MITLKRSHKLAPTERKRKIDETTVPCGWADPGTRILLRKEELLKICGLSDSSFASLKFCDDPFPAPYLFITPHQPRWLGSEVAAWLLRRRERREEFARQAVPSSSFKKKEEA